LIQPLDVVVFQPLKHYHAKELDIMIRDGVGDIGKLEFLTIIERVRQQAFKKKTIESAFRKTGIWPYKPSAVLDELRQRVATPEADPGRPGNGEILSPPPNATPTTLRQTYRMASQVRNDIKDLDLSPEVHTAIKRITNSAVYHATESLQAIRDLARTQHAEKMKRARRQHKNIALQSGGVLTVAGARSMVKRREEDSLEKARNIVAAADQKAINSMKRLYHEAAKRGRKRILEQRIYFDVFEKQPDQPLKRRSLLRF
jgi:DNA primase